MNEPGVPEMGSDIIITYFCVCLGFLQLRRYRKEKAKNVVIYFKVNPPLENSLCIEKPAGKLQIPKVAV